VTFATDFELPKTLMCGEIRGQDRLPLRCIPVIRHRPELLVEATASDSTGAIPEVKREAYGRLYAHLAEKKISLFPTSAQEF